MKGIILVFCLSFFSLGLFGGNTTEFHWKPTHHSFDSIVNLLEKGFISDDNNHNRDKQINLLYSIAKATPDKPVFLWRAAFWDARAQLKKSNIDSTLCLIEKAYNMVDAIHYSYDYMRIKHLRTILHKKKVHLIYKELKEIAEYYSSINDLFMLAHAYIDMGNILSRLQDNTKALEYLQKADTYYKQLKEPIYEAKNQLNIANVLYLLDDKQQADDMLMKLLSNPVCVKDTSFFINTLLLLSEHDDFHNQEFIFKAYNLSKHFANKGLSIYSTTYVGLYYQNKNQIDSALFFYKKAYDLVNERNADLLVPILKNMSECYAVMHHLDSAYVYLNQYEIYKDSLNQANSLAEIRRIESRSAIEKYEAELRQTEERSRFQFILTFMICTFIICIAILVCYIFWKRHREEKIKKQLQELENKELTTRLEKEALQNNYFKVELASKERELTSNSLIIMEKNQVLKSLLEEIEKEKEVGHVNSNTMIKIGKDIKRHLGTNDEWEFFKIQFEKVHPDFFSKLKSLYPSITEGELRLCSYIRIGMENKQIAQMLSLQPDSVKKTRYRIRKKMGIELEDSLEDSLRNI